MARERAHKAVFSGQISAMEGALFMISLMENAHPFTSGSPFCLPRETMIGVGLTSTARYHSPSSTTHRVVCADSGGP